MNLQAIVDAMNKSAEMERAKYQATLGSLIELLSTVDPTLLAVYDMAAVSYPSAPQSYRGYYSDLSLPPSSTPIKVGELLIKAKDAMGSTFEGYKGGDFEMHSDTPLWASPYGSADGVAIMDAEVIGDKLVLITKQID